MSNEKDEAKVFIEANVSGSDVVIFSKTWCGYCSRTKDLFRSPEFKGLSVNVIELDSMPAGAPKGPAVQFMLNDITGQRSVPNVWVKGKFLGGNDDTQAAYRSGKLQAML